MRTTFSKQKSTILVVEDSEEDFKALLRAIEKSALQVSVEHCLDGDDALDFLLHTGAYKNTEEKAFPALILLDLNLPGTDGKEILVEIKNHQQLSIIPVIIFSSSSNPQDLEHCHKNGASEYIIKPMNIQEMQEIIKTLLEHWLETDSPRDFEPHTSSIDSE